MPKKKQPRNAFYFFMLDFKARAERNGERFPNGLRDVQNEASPEWNVMSAELKQKYEDMAKEEKGRMKTDYNKQTCWHNSFSSIEKQKERIEEEKNTMKHYVKSQIQMLTNQKALSEFKFYVIHVNYFCISEGECYHPAELALCEFSLGGGVTNVYHTIIDPGQVPLGYRHDAQSKSEASHKIPVDENGGERDFYKILSAVKRFLEPGRLAQGGEYPPMFTLPDNVNLNTSMSAVKSVMENLCFSDSAEYENVEKYRVYPLEYLFLELQNACASVGERGDGEDEDEEGGASRQLNKLPSIGLALMELEKDVFNYTPNIACEFHNKEDVVEYCSKSFVQRWVYLICDHCCQFLNINMLPGRHMPENADINFSRNRRKAREEEEKAAPVRVNPYKQQPPPLKPWVPISNPPLPRPTVKANLAAMLPRESPPFDSSEDSFPAIAIGHGRGRLPPRGGAKGGGAPFSFADAMKNKK